MLKHKGKITGLAEESWAAMEPGIVAMVKEIKMGVEQDESISVEIAEDAQAQR